ncbi:MAG TPA: S8 family serine peptidase [Candidatus Binatia bacterium]|nr:S8 family serine peptidase [Candidatus Binatia bacterium]
MIAISSVTTSCPPARRAAPYRALLAFWLVLLCAASFSASAVDTLSWNTNRDRVTADIKTARLFNVLEKIATATRWHVFMEPETGHTVSAKFENLRPGEALPLLLGDVNYALMPATTNAGTRLYVFRTSRQNATQLVPPANDAAAKSKLLANELIVRLKPGAKIDDLARKLGAKVIGRIDGLNAYRLQFDDQAAADSAREQLTGNSDVASVDSNYTVDPPPAPHPLQSGGSSVSPPQLQIKPPPDSGRVIVGLVDTAVQPLGNNLDQFVLKQISVAGDSQLDPNSPSHGTSMAETLLRSIQSMTAGNTSVQILPVDVFGPNETTTTFDVASGIQQAGNNGAKIINLSLGSPGDSPFLQSIIQSALANNILVVAAAGNTGDSSLIYPAGYQGVNPVTALSDPTHIASYADHGSWISLGAPGTSMIVYNNQPWSVVGTSPAAAFTSGTAAGYMDANQSTTAQAQSFIQKNFGIKIAGGK